MSDYELVRVSRDAVQRLIDDDSEPVVVVRLDRREDGSCDMWLKAPERRLVPLDAVVAFLRAKAEGMHMVANVQAFSTAANMVEDRFGSSRVSVVPQPEQPA